MKISPFDTIVDRRDSDSIKWQKFNKKVIPMWVADMEFATPRVITDALQHRIEHPIFGYTSASESLHSCIADYCLKRHDWSIETNCLHWVPGVLPALTAACQIAGQLADSRGDDEIIVFPPVYHPLLEIPKKIGKTRVDVPMIYEDQTFCIDFDLLEKSFTSNTVALLLSSPHNPMGVVFNEQDLYRLATLCAQHKVLLISDEIHCDLILNNQLKHIPTALAAREHKDIVITIMSPSKTFNLAGANCSFAHIKDPVVQKKFSAECTYTVPFVPTLSYTAAEAAYSSGWEWHEKLIEYLRSNHDYLHTAINSSPLLTMDRTDATYLAWIDTRKLMDEDANQFFEKAGVGLSPGTQFGDCHYQRLNFACSRAQLEQGVERMLNAVKQML